jgi:glycine cleavage system aminomethyltransferase T
MPDRAATKLTLNQMLAWQEITSGFYGAMQPREQQLRVAANGLRTAGIVTSTLSSPIQGCAYALARIAARIAATGMPSFAS